MLVLEVTAQEADLLLASLDPLAGMAQADPAVLGELLASVATSSAAVRELLEGLARGAGLPLVLPLRDPDWVPEAPRRSRTRPGEVWALGDHRLACGDARDGKLLARLMDGEGADVLWTDPPYGISYEGKTPRRLRIDGDTSDGLEKLLAGAFGAGARVLAAGARIYVAHPAGPLSVLFSHAFLAQGWRLRQTLVWVKDCMVLGHADYHYPHEPILYGYAQGPGRWGRGAKGWFGGAAETSVIEVARPTASPDHPTTKPVDLIKRCLRNSSKEGDRVLDLFAGSGSTLIACELLGRRGYGVEIDPSY